MLAWHLVDYIYGIGSGVKIRLIEVYQDPSPPRTKVLAKGAIPSHLSEPVYIGRGQPSGPPRSEYDIRKESFCEWRWEGRIHIRDEI